MKDPRQRIRDIGDAWRAVTAWAMNGKHDNLQVQGLPVTSVTVRDSGHVVVRYKVEQGRELRYTYTREAAGPKLTVVIQFVERGNVVDTVRRVYDLIGPDDPFPTTPGVTKTAAGTVAEGPALPPPPGLRALRRRMPRRPSHSTSSRAPS